MKKLIHILLSAIILLTCSCSKENNTEISKDNPLFGKWKLLKIQGETIAEPNNKLVRQREVFSHDSQTDHILIIKDGGRGDIILDKSYKNVISFNYTKEKIEFTYDQSALNWSMSLNNYPKTIEKYEMKNGKLFMTSNKTDCTTSSGPNDQDGSTCTIYYYEFLKI